MLFLVLIILSYAMIVYLIQRYQQVTKLRLLISYSRLLNFVRKVNNLEYVYFNNGVDNKKIPNQKELFLDMTKQVFDFDTPIELTDKHCFESDLYFVNSLIKNQPHNSIVLINDYVKNLIENSENNNG